MFLLRFACQLVLVCFSKTIFFMHGDFQCTLRLLDVNIRLHELLSNLRQYYNQQGRLHHVRLKRQRDPFSLLHPAVQTVPRPEARHLLVRGQIRRAAARHRLQRRQHPVQGSGKQQQQRVRIRATPITRPRAHLLFLSTNPPASHVEIWKQNKGKKTQRRLETRTIRKKHGNRFD